MNHGESNTFINQDNFNQNNDQNFDARIESNDFMNPNDTHFQKEIRFFQEDENEEFQSIFDIESKYHSAKFSGKSKLNLTKSKKICLDPPAVYSFKDIVGIPNQIQKQNIKIEQFLKTRIDVEKQLEKIGLEIDQTINKSNDIASSLAEQILSLQNYRIQNSQQGLNEAIIEQDVYMQQPDLISPNDIKPYKASNLIFLNELFQSELHTTDNLQDTMNEICQHYTESSFDVDQAINILQELSEI